jgi:hypothetical protein
MHVCLLMNLQHFSCQISREEVQRLYFQVFRKVFLESHGYMGDVEYCYRLILSSRIGG